MRLTERASRGIALRALAGLEGGRLELIEPDGATHLFGESSAELGATIKARSSRFFRAAMGGSIGLGKAYRDGIWDTNDPVALLRIATRNLPRLDQLRRRLQPLLAPLQRTVWRVPRNSRGKSRNHISAHYDLGNDLFALFLDESMMYSSAWFPSPEASLAEAQEARLDRVCRALELGHGDHLLEIGTGWGGFAVHAASRFGCRVTTSTISEEQREGAQRRIAQAGLEDRITVLLEDYRDLSGRFDKLVSLEMIEAVGWQYFDRFFRRCSELLAPNGLMFLQAITIDDRAYELEKAARSFANTLIFPGGCLPSVEVIQRSVAKETDLSTVWLDDISPHYAETLRLWRERFLANSDLAAELGYDERFQRLWTLWLAMSEAGFREGRLRDVQILFAKPGRRPALAETYGGVGAEEASSI